MTPENAMLTLVTAAVGDVPVVLSGLTESPASTPCIAMTVRWVDAGPAETGRVDNDGNQTVHDHRDATVLLRSVGLNAYHALHKVGLILMHPNYEERAEALDLALFHVGRVERLPDDTAGGPSEAQGQLELGIRYAQTYVDEVGVIETVAGAFTATGGLTPSLHTPFSAKTDVAL